MSRSVGLYSRRPAAPVSLTAPVQISCRRRVATSAAASAGRTVAGILLRRLLLPGSALIGGSFGLEHAKSQFPDLSDYLGGMDAFTETVVQNVGLAANWVSINAAQQLKGIQSKGSLAEAKSTINNGAPKSQAPSSSSSSDSDGAENDIAAQAASRVQELREELDALKDDRDHDLEKHQQELLELQSLLQAEIDALTEDNKALRRRLVFDSAENPGAASQRSAAEMYADILNMRETADGAFKLQDHLPRVVVLGDQSAGKTSVLEMIAQARIFPRGDGEMMTRTPIQVTMSPSSEHCATIRGSSRIYKLDNRADLAALREQISRRMNASVPRGASVSKTTISLDVRGPGLRPMVLVDLPGMIQHHTLGMSNDTKDTIHNICRSHIENPHSIILCIQDATRDAEGSGFADIVREIDPKGNRTIFVLTKVDLAEKLNKPTQRLQKILRGQVFDMKASNYFAVVTGTNDPRDSIDDIRRAEKKFFEQSDLFFTGVVKANSMGTDNLSRAVSKSFWEIVNASIDSELQTISSELKRKENEWKSRYDGRTRMSRADLFVIGRHNILEAMSDFNDNVKALSLEQLFTKELESRIKDYFIDVLYVGAAEDAEPGSFKSNCENLLEAWVQQDLADVAINVAHRSLMEQLESVINFPDKDGTFGRLKKHVLKLCNDKLEWPVNSSKKIHHLQELKLRDNVVADRESWAQACDYMVRVLNEEVLKERYLLQKEVGSDWLFRWLYWERQSRIQKARRHAKNSLEAFFPTDRVARAGLTAEEANGIKLEVNRATGANVDDDFIHETYKFMYKLHFLQLSKESAVYCRGRYGQHESDNVAKNGLACSDVLLFWRMQNMLKATGNVLRVEALDFKRNMEEEVRETLAEIQEDRVAIQEILQSPQVTLAEEIDLIRLTQSKLNSFVDKLKKESKVDGKRR